MTLPPRPWNGAIFAAKLPTNDCCIIQVLYDFWKIRKKRLNNKAMEFCNDALLVTVFKEPCQDFGKLPTQKLIPGLIVYAPQNKEDWVYVKTESIPFEELEFPETVDGERHSSGDACFRKGDIVFPLPFTRSQIEDIGCRTAIRGGEAIPGSYLWLVGREDEIPAEMRGTIPYRNYDLRLSDRREEIYRYLPFSMKDKYYEQQKQMGLRIENLFEDVE